MYFHQWKRREFIALFGAAATTWPFAALTVSRDFLLRADEVIE